MGEYNQNQENDLQSEQENICETNLDEDLIQGSLKEQKNKILHTLKEIRSKGKIDFVWLIVWIIVFSFLIYAKSNVRTNLSIIQLIFYYLFSVGCFVGIITKWDDVNKNTKTKVDSNFKLSIIKDDIFLEEIKGLSYEEKALKQLSKKQADIERYHSLNLSHTKVIFVIGVIIIFIGILIIASTVISILVNENSVQLIVVISGFVGGLMVDLVGAVFILMYTKTIESANKYQANMAETANTYLGNVLVSQISNTELRERTLSEMSKELVQKNKND
jgi:hypothetical protein